jgi:hypothetical protein
METIFKITMDNKSSEAISPGGRSNAVKNMSRTLCLTHIQYYELSKHGKTTTLDKSSNKTVTIEVGETRPVKGFK